MSASQYVKGGSSKVHQQGGFPSSVDIFFHIATWTHFVYHRLDCIYRLFINMKKFLAILWTFEGLLHFNQQFSSNLQIGDKLCTNHK